MDLILQLFDLYVERGYPPDVLSKEFPGPVIRLEWFSGKRREFGYTKARWDLMFDEFNRFWRSFNDQMQYVRPRELPGQ